MHARKQTHLVPAPLHLILVAASALFWTTSPAQAQPVVVYDLAEDWSDVANPNGPWTLTGDNGAVLSNNEADWDPGNSFFSAPQAVWAAARFPLAGHVPMWFKASSTKLLDIPIGRVGMHGSAGNTTAYVGVTWTSPLDSTIDILGGVWQAIQGSGHTGRASDWRITHNGVPLTGGTVSESDSSSSSQPLALSSGSGGPSAVTGITVQSGDRITLEFISPTTTATFVGLDFTITLPALLPYGAGLAGSGGIAPQIGTGGEFPQAGNSSFLLQLTDAVGGAPALIAGSLQRSDQSLFGLTVYGDYLTPGAFVYGLRMTSGMAGAPGVGTAMLSIPIPNDPSLRGLGTYWQAFVLDPASPASIGFTHTGGLAVVVFR